MCVSSFFHFSFKFFLMCTVVFYTSDCSCVYMYIITMNCVSLCMAKDCVSKKGERNQGHWKLLQLLKTNLTLKYKFRPDKDLYWFPNGIYMYLYEGVLCYLTFLSDFKLSFLCLGVTGWLLSHNCFFWLITFWKFSSKHCRETFRGVQFEYIMYCTV